MISQEIAVVGAGIFGCVLASELSDRGHTVTLFDRKEDIFSEASQANQYRLHRGYHYPRSEATIQETLKGTQRFEKIFSEAVVRGYRNYYAISDTGSKTTEKEFESILARNSLKFKKIDIPEYLQNISLLIESNENLYDYAKLKKIMETKLGKRDIRLKLGTAFTKEFQDDFDKIFICTYGRNVDLKNVSKTGNRKYRVQLVEKPIFRAPERFKHLSLVVMDGPFCCIDPIANTGTSVVGHVIQAIHKMEEDAYTVSESYYDLLNEYKKNPRKNTRYKNIQSEICHFIPKFRDAEYQKSMWAVRVVPGNVAATDERPTLITKCSENVFSILSGKVSTSVNTLNSLITLYPEANL